ncbi:Shedu immune nuclease family protein [Psychromicrobium xiongbiense]|uniref:Shedu immune nuclease family protein n=1 Tax=Psychromicrobium xiongbiense TaxID=3051184 RepID=UPI0025538B3A|nr:Shedu immune nuclease family protein [Psychromicrobium sp. YIM S02556]
MITFQDVQGQVVLTYSPDQFGPEWLDSKLRAGGEATLVRTFTVRKADALPSGNDERKFVVGTITQGYRSIRKEVLQIKHDLLIDVECSLSPKTFVAERSISVFRHIDELVDQQIVIGGERDDSMPVSEFVRLLNNFPSSTELKYYAETRITRVLKEYFATVSDAELRLAKHMDRRRKSAASAPARMHGRAPAANELEFEKLIYIRTRLQEMLVEAESYSEAEWQAAVSDLFLLIFPQYIAVLDNVLVKDQYSNADKSTNRYIDLMLVGVNGYVDIIEIKKPFDRGLVSSRRYRDNHVPVRELSGSIMQAEKYLFHLNKSGREGERKIAAKHAGALPSGVDVRIANPKAFILTGRDANLLPGERFDLEIIRRKYSNVVDIISYDDLLRRLENSIAAISKRLVLDRPGDSVGEAAE